MSAESARASIAALHAQGFSNSAIARAIGRDHKQIDQIASDARGPGYGQGLAPALAQLAERGATRPPGFGLPEVSAPRRQTRAGSEARVRQPVQPVKRPTENVTTTRGTLPQPLNAVVSEGIALGRAVTITATVEWPDGRRQEVTLFGKGGWRAGAFRRYCNAHGGINGGISSLVTDALVERYGLDEDEAEAAEVVDVEISAW